MDIIIVIEEGCVVGSTADDQGYAEPRRGLYTVER